MRKTAMISIIVIIISSILISSCGSRTVKGGAIGAGLGGLIGGILGKQKDETAKGAIIGAAVGGTAGAFIGRYMDNQAEDMQRDLEGAKVERIGEGIKIIFESGILFTVDSAELSNDAKENIGKFATILNKYPDTDILVEGHTDSDGSDEYNQRLSERRVQAVVAYIVTNGVSGNRFTAIGYGEKQPVASNDTSDGKRLNRRVEVAIMANEKLKNAAEKGNL